MPEGREKVVRSILGWLEDVKDGLREQNMKRWR
jgi:hypothetical protein